jgi:choline dehydrogenase
MHDAGTFDYIITGAGSAGCVLAARLTESGRHTVLLLEAGAEDKGFWVHVPMGYPMLFANPALNWMFESEPEVALGNRSLYQARGKLLGGTSSINGMVYIRGHPEDYDLWRQMGCTGWAWNDVLPYFKKSEDQQRGPSELHGTGGPLTVSDQPRRFEIADAIIEAAVQTGIARNPDFNGPVQEGIGYFQINTRRNRRLSTAQAFLKPSQGRPNLAVRTFSLASRVVFENGRAAAVEFRSKGATFLARARREVLVSGGVYGSPQLLQLSGIGPGEHLQRVGIDIVKDVPVGNNLQDHFYAQLTLRSSRAVTMNDIANSKLRSLLAGIQYVLMRRGPLSSNGIYAGGFVRSNPRLDRPDIQLSMNPGSVLSRTASGLKVHPFSGFTLNAIFLRPESRGTVRLKSIHPEAPPEIRFNVFSARSDLDAVVGGLRIARTISEQPAMKPYVSAEIAPGADVRSDEDLERYVRLTGSSASHPVGTCRMGQDEKSVVDPQLRVRGVTGLRVVDASVMPIVPAGNTNAPTIMIAEKASDMILATD